MCKLTVPVLGALMCVVVLNACASLAPTTAPLSSDARRIPKDVYQKVLPAIFEVVIERPKEEGVVYERPLPLEKLPYRARTDKYLSIGTAFAIGPNEFVSAAHVFPLYLTFSKRTFYLRDQNGEVYPVEKVLKYSTYRDLISFSLSQTPAVKAYLPLAKVPTEIGDGVLVIGNAQGEGISLRSGQVSSFTPEEVENKWRFIRFSAPASPGNSGGPLLSESGDVVGVVTRKNLSENLNYAVPISELAALSSSHSEFIIRNEKFTRNRTSEEKTWTFAQALPEQLSVLNQKAESDFQSFNEAGFRALYAPEDPRFFPNNADYLEYARHQNMRKGIGVVAAPAAGSRWETRYYKLRSVPIDQERAVEFDEIKGQYVFRIRKPKDVSAADYVTQPRRLFEDANKGLGINRSFLGEKIRMVSLGEPKDVEKWQDQAQRKWQRARWEVGASSTIFELNCTPVPDGAVCVLNIVPADWSVGGGLMIMRNVIAEHIFSYEGTVGEWKDYLKHSEWLPPFLSKGSIELANGKLSARFGQKVFTLRDSKGGEQSEFYLKTRFVPVAKPDVEIGVIGFVPQKSVNIVYAKHWLWKPRDSAPASVQDHWMHVEKADEKFDGKPHEDGKWSDVSLPLKKLTQDGIPLYSYLECSAGTDAPREGLTDTCKTLAKLQN